MKCVACGSEIAGNARQCPCCGLPLFFPVAKAGNVQGAKLWQQAGQQYRQAMLDDVTVYLVGKFYRLEEDKLEADHTERIQLYRASQLSMGTVCWAQQEFVRIQPEQELELELVITRGKAEQTCRVTVAYPDQAVRWKIGLELQDGLKLRVLVGDEQSHTSSEAIRLLAR